MIVDLNMLSEVSDPCPACQEQSLCGKKITPNKRLALSGLTSLSATRCYACGDVRLYGTYADNADRAELRGELDFLSAMLSEVAIEEISSGRH